MLILSRKVGETIVIGDGDSRIVIRVDDVRDGEVRLAIESPVGTRIATVRRDDGHPTPVPPNVGPTWRE